MLFTAGTPDGPKLASGKVLQGQGGGGLDALLDLGPTLRPQSKTCPRF